MLIGASLVCGRIIVVTNIIRRHPRRFGRPLACSKAESESAWVSGDIRHNYTVRIVFAESNTFSGSAAEPSARAQAVVGHLLENRMSHLLQSASLGQKSEKENYTSD